MCMCPACRERDGAAKHTSIWRKCAVHAQASEYTRESNIETITVPVGPRLGDIVVEVKGVTKAYGDRTLMENLSFSIPPGSIVGQCSQLQAHENCLEEEGHYLCLPQSLCFLSPEARCARCYAPQAHGSGSVHLMC